MSFQSSSIETEARVTNAVLYFPGFLLVVVMLLGTLVRRWRLAPAFRLVDRLVFIPQGRPSHTHFVVVPDFQEYGAMLERSLRKPSPLSFCRETSPHCVGHSGPRASKPWSSIFGRTRLCPELPLVISAALFRQRNKGCIVLAIEARVGPSTQDRAEHLTAATGHPFEDLMATGHSPGMLEMLRNYHSTHSVLSDSSGRNSVWNFTSVCSCFGEADTPSILSSVESQRLTEDCHNALKSGAAMNSGFGQIVHYICDHGHNVDGNVASSLSRRPLVSQ